MLSTAAFNALLKTLEEPPAHVKFMFATTDPEKVLPTILSRCQRFDLRRIPSALITKHLAEIAKKEKVKIDQTALFAIARGADGGMRDAESTLDQLISFCGDKIEEPDVLSMFGLAAESQILNLSKAVLAGEIQTALTQLNGLAQNGKDLGRLLSDLLNHFRNLLIFQISHGDVNLLEVSEAETLALKEQSPLATAGAFTRILEVFADAELNLRDATSKKILLEVTLLKAIEARNAVPIDALLKQLTQLRGGGQNSAGVSPANAPTALPATKATETVKREAPSSASTVQHVNAPPAPADLSALWGQLAELVGKASPFVRTYLLDAFPISFDNNLLTIGFDPEFEDHLGLVDNARNHTLLQTKLAELGHPNCQIKFIKAEAPETAAPKRREGGSPTTNPTAPQVATSTLKPGATAGLAAKEKASVPFNKNDFKNDPLIQRALEIFKGQIVEVRA
jgi:DNA polymerase-3 subunit gamma/tau